MDHITTIELARSGVTALASWDLSVFLDVLLRLFVNIWSTCTRNGRSDATAMCESTVSRICNGVNLLFSNIVLNDFYSQNIAQKTNVAFLTLPNE